MVRSLVDRRTDAAGRGSSSTPFRADTTDPLDGKALTRV